MWLFTAPEAMIKGLLEAETEVALVSGPREGGLGAIFDIAAASHIVPLLRQHNMRVTSAPRASRAIALALNIARVGRSSVAIIPNDQLDLAIDELHQAMSVSLDRGGAMAVLLEDSPRDGSTSCPRVAAQRTGLPALEVADLEQLREAIEQALRLSRAGRSP